MIQSDWLSTIAIPQSKTIDDNHREGRRRFRATLLGGYARNVSAVLSLPIEIADLEQSIREEKDSKCDEILFIGDVYIGLHMVELEQRRSCGEMVFRGPPPVREQRLTLAFPMFPLSRKFRR